MPWELRGNAATNPYADYFGTSDAQPLVISTNGTEAIHVGLDQRVALGTANPADGARLTLVGALTIGEDRVYPANASIHVTAAVGTVHGRLTQFGPNPKQA